METTQTKNTHPEIFQEVNENIKVFVDALNEAHIKDKYELLYTKYNDIIETKEAWNARYRLEDNWNKRETPYLYYDLNFNFLLFNKKKQLNSKLINTEETKKIEETKNLPLDTELIERIIQANIYINLSRFMENRLKVSLIKDTNSETYNPKLSLNDEEKQNCTYNEEKENKNCHFLKTIYTDVDGPYKKFCYFLILKTNIDTLKKNNHLIDVDMIKINDDYDYLYDLNSFLVKMNSSTNSNKFRISLENKEDEEKKSKQQNKDIYDKNYFETQIEYFFDIFYHTMCEIFPNFDWRIPTNKYEGKETDEIIEKYIASDVMVEHDKKILPLIECLNHISKYIDHNDDRYKIIVFFLKTYDKYLGQIDDFKVEKYKVVRNNKSNKNDFKQIISPDIFDYGLMHIKDKINLYRDLFKELGSFKLYKLIENHEENHEQIVEEQFGIINKINDDYIDELVNKVEKVEKSSLSDFFIILIESENINFSNKLKLHDKLKNQVNEAAMNKYISIVGYIQDFIKYKLYDFLEKKKEKEKLTHIKKINMNIDINDKYFSFYLNYLNILQDICFILDDEHSSTKKNDNDSVKKIIGVLSNYQEFYENKFLNIETINELYLDYYDYFKNNHIKFFKNFNNIIDKYEERNGHFYLKKKKKKISTDTMNVIKLFLNSFDPKIHQ